MRKRHAIFAIVAVAFGLRLGAGLLRGAGFVDAGYSFYADIARTFLSGGGFCLSPGHGCADRVPLYPLLVSPFLAADVAYPWLIVLQALVGAMIPLAVWEIGRELFSDRVGLLAAVAAALNPYAVIHATSFQDTVIVNALVALSVLLLIKSANSRGTWLIAAGGTALALATLTSARVLPLAAFAAVWIVTFGSPHQARLRRTCAFLLPVVLLVGGWTARNARVLGAPALTTESGLSLWMGNHPLTMAFYPNRSVDELGEAELRSLPLDEIGRLEMLASNPLAQDRHFGRMAWQYIVANPMPVAEGAALKVVFAFAGWLSPARNWPIQLGYAAIFFPINVLAMIGLWRSSGNGAGHVLVCLVFLALVVTTAVFWSHTSHGSHLQAFKFIYAAAMLQAWLDRRHAGSAETDRAAEDARQMQRARGAAASQC